jgi:hypothetical protein
MLPLQKGYSPRLKEEMPDPEARGTGDAGELPRGPPGRGAPLLDHARRRGAQQRPAGSDLQAGSLQTRVIHCYTIEVGRA